MNKRPEVSTEHLLVLGDMFKILCVLNSMKLAHDKLFILYVEISTTGIFFSLIIFSQFNPCMSTSILYWYT